MEENKSCVLKKTTQCESCESSFTWGKVGTTTRGRASRSSEKLCLQRERSVSHAILAGRGVCVVKLTFCQRFPASPEGQMSPLLILVLFCIWDDTRIGLINFSPEYTWQSEGLWCQLFPEHRVPHFSSLP